MSASSRGDKTEQRATQRDIRTDRGSDNVLFTTLQYSSNWRWQKLTEEVTRTGAKLTIVVYWTDVSVSPLQYPLRLCGWRAKARFDQRFHLRMHHACFSQTTRWISAPTAQSDRLTSREICSGPIQLLLIHRNQQSKFGLKDDLSQPDNGCESNSVGKLWCFGNSFCVCLFKRPRTAIIGLRNS